MSKPTVFISHAHRDFRLAEALHAAFETCFRGHVLVRRSSKTGEIDYGNNWIEWIHAQVADCSLAIVLLTPTSIQNPWVLYEAGGVDGVTRALGGLEPGRDRRLVCVSFLRQSGEMPGPFFGRAYVNARDEGSVIEFLKKTVTRFRDDLGPEQAGNALIDLRQTAAAFVEAADTALLHTPIERSEALIQEWCDRIDKIVAEGKLQEAASLHRMIGVAFYGEADRRGRTRRPGERFLDFRLHRRFGELFYDLRRYKEAAEEYRLALDVAPRDVYLLHRLGLALVRDKAFPEAKTVLDTIDKVDPDVASESEDIAALKARFFKDQDRLSEAIAVLRAYKHRRQSYYVQNNIAIYGLQLQGEITETILQDFRECREVAANKANVDFWARGTLVNCLLALGDDAEAARHLHLLRREANDPNDLETAAQFYDAIIEKRPGGRNGLDWREASLGASVHPLRSASG